MWVDGTKRWKKLVSMALVTHGMDAEDSIQRTFTVAVELDDDDDYLLSTYLWNRSKGRSIQWDSSCIGIEGAATNSFCHSPALDYVRGAWCWHWKPGSDCCQSRNSLQMRSCLRQCVLGPLVSPISLTMSGRNQVHKPNAGSVFQFILFPKSEAYSLECIRWNFVIFPRHL